MKMNDYVVPKLKFYMYYDQMTMSFKIIIFRKSDNGREVLSQEGWVEVPYGQDLPVLLRLEEFEMDDFANQMVESLDKLGYNKTSGELKSMESHLNDMRKITFHQLKIDK